MSGSNGIEYLVRRVSQASLMMLEGVLEDYIQSEVEGAQPPVAALMQGFFQQLYDPNFLLLAVVRKEDQQTPVGFLAARVQTALIGREVYIYALYISPSETSRARAALRGVLVPWAKLQQADRIKIHTSRIDADGKPKELRAWKKLGFQPEAVLLTNTLEESGG